MTWNKLSALEHSHGSGCLNCPSPTLKADMDKVIAVGFGDAHASRDEEEVYREPGVHDTSVRCTEPECEWGVIGKDPRGPLCGKCGGTGWVEDPDAKPSEYWDFAEVEKLAAIDPDHDWRVTLYGPLHGEVYQRHGPDEWVMVESNQGFA